jgi:hypothetical protein
MRARDRVLVIVLALIAASPAWAQSSNAGAGSQQPTRRVIPLVRVRATLETTLDTKHAKPGELVRARLDENVPIPNGPTIPRNAILEGRVDKVQASQHHSDSSVVITFDQAKLRDGEVLLVKVTVLSISEPVPPGMEEPATMPANAGAPAGAPPAPTRPGNFPLPPGSDAESAPAESQTPQLPQGPAAPPPPLTRAVPGVTLESDVNSASSASFLAEGRNVRVPGGVQMQVAVGVIPKGVRLR